MRIYRGAATLTTCLPTHPPRSSPPTPAARTLLGVGKGLAAATASGLLGYLTQVSKERSLPLWKVNPSGLSRSVPGWTPGACSHGGLFLQSCAKGGSQRSEQLEMGTEKEIPEPDCQKQFQAAVRVIQNLPKNSSE